MKESKYNFYCDSCYTEKSGVRKDLDPDSENTCIYRQPFRCIKKEQWTRHLKTNKHILNISNANNLKDELVHECKYCNVRLDDRSFKIHTQRNYLLWASSHMDWAKECSCNNFILNGKRFNTVGALRDYYTTKEKYSYGKDKNIDYRKKLFDQANKILQDKEKYQEQMIEARKRNEEKMKKQVEDRKAKQALALKEKRKEKEKEEEEENQLQLTIEDIEYNKLNGIEDKVDPKTDLNEPPDFCDFCEDCGKPDNTLHKYSIYKLEKYEIDICDCESDEE